MTEQTTSTFVICDTDTLQAAMVAIDTNLHRSVVVVNDKNVVVGTLSDGDIRKALLDGRLLATPVHRVMNIDFTALTRSEINRARGILAEGHILLIPVIDEHGKLLEVVSA
jgi:mannose-1-phosphate guanylyltransferase/mannose-6-phosphate isomerase